MNLPGNGGPAAHAAAAFSNVKNYQRRDEAGLRTPMAWLRRHDEYPD